MRKSLILVLVLLVTMFISIGCELEEIPETPAPQTPTQPQIPALTLNNLDLTERISNEWKGTGKAFAIPDPAGRGIGCAQCHDGYGFSMFNTYNPNVTGAPAYAPKHPTGIDCQACHTGRGKELMDSGSVQLPFNAQPLQAGKSANCMACHNGNRNPETLAQQFQAGTLARLTYPHYGMQAAVTTGQGGMAIPGVTLPSTVAHSSTPCITCHMPYTNEGYKSHTFKADVANINQTCGTCHAGITDFNYNGFQTEITDLLTKVKKAAIEKAGASDLTYAGGAFTFHDAQGAEIDIKQIPFEAYVGAYNWRLIALDGSGGIHNPQYARSILRETYRFITGQQIQ
ncbi:hypothetical protein BHU72_04205 [Desulfuribacillus stibiiarsenatis]|uniref:Cytochrome c7-like domain-containing protein n=1 Tax=Desulfuribacillus stibiiarsenatis TaxID=1390249 RepID=A0A1E5L5G1_9FIRM|nr:ammonia-forming cytochrome c nitrite reductase subunit c552 [Desulfuribacillus stibiiarsenatis]OEH85304.1 hypothetical protein BHU72_04205 [Desulfuribacillus stibiiarsenatis]